MSRHNAIHTDVMLEMQARKPIVWSAAASVPAETATAAVPADAPVTESSAPAEVSEADKQKARALKFGISTEKVDTTAKVSGCCALPGQKIQYGMAR